MRTWLGTRRSLIPPKGADKLNRLTLTRPAVLARQDGYFVSDCDWFASRELKRPQRLSNQLAGRVPRAHRSAMPVARLLKQVVSQLEARPADRLHVPSIAHACPRTVR